MALPPIRTRLPRSLRPRSPLLMQQRKSRRARRAATWPKSFRRTTPMSTLLHLEHGVASPLPAKIWTTKLELGLRTCLSAPKNAPVLPVAPVPRFITALYARKHPFAMSAVPLLLPTYLLRSLLSPSRVRLCPPLQLTLQPLGISIWHLIVQLPLLPLFPSVPNCIRSLVLTLLVLASLIGHLDSSAGVLMTNLSCSLRPPLDLVPTVGFLSGKDRYLLNLSYNIHL
jgi:hypothetical protein